MSCVICYEALFSDAPTPQTDKCKLAALCCGHVFHETCVNNWLIQPNRKTCPLCRKQANGSPLQLFFEEEEKEEEQKGEDIGSDSALRSDAGDLKEVDKLNNDVQMLTISLSAAEQRNTDLQKQHEEMLARLCAREIEHTGELQMAARRTSQAAPQRIHFLEAQADTKDNAIRRLESHVEDLLATISELICALDAKSEELEAAQRTIDKRQAAQGIESAAAQNPTERLRRIKSNLCEQPHWERKLSRGLAHVHKAEERAARLREKFASRACMYQYKRTC